MKSVSPVQRSLIVTAMVALTLTASLASATAANAGRRDPGMDECTQSAEGNGCGGGPFDGMGSSGPVTGQPDGNTGWAPVAVNNSSTVVAEPNFRGDTLYATYANGQKDWFLQQRGNENPGSGTLYFNVNVGSGAEQIPSVGEALNVIHKSSTLKLSCTNAGPTTVVCHY